MKRVRFQNCCDEQEIVISYALNVAYKAYKNQKCNCTICTRWKGSRTEINPLSSIKGFVAHLCCPPVPYPADSDEFCAERLIYQQSCCFGKCPSCKQRFQSPDCCFSCPVLWGSAKVSWRTIETIEFENTSPGSKKTKFTKKILSMRHGTMQELRGFLVDVPHGKNESRLELYLQHYWLYNYLNCTRLHDIESLTKNTIFIQTDFSSQIILQGQQSLCCQQPDVANLSCWVIVFHLK